ncbi:MAG: tetratricopeptide repeat protein [Pirellulales bacterium]
MTSETPAPAEPSSGGERDGETTSPPAAPPRHPVRTVLVTTLFLVATLGWFYQWHHGSAAQRFRRAVAALDHHDANGVRRELAAWPASDQYDPHRHFLAGALLLQEGQPALALDEFQFSADVPELRVRTLTLAGQALYLLGRYVEALNLLLQAIAEDDQPVAAHRWLASCYVELGAGQLAVPHLTTVATRDPHDPRPHRLLGVIQRDAEHDEEAVACYRESLRRDPQQRDAPQIALELAECQTRLRDFAGALETLRLGPDTPDAWLLAAECEEGLGRWEPARQLVDRTLAAAPQAAPPRIRSASLLLATDRAADAATELEKIVAQSPHELLAHQLLATACERLGRTADAAQHRATAEQLKQARARFTQRLAEAAANAQDATLRSQLGQAAWELGRPDLAELWWRRALLIDPNHGPAAAGLQKLSASPAP